MPLPAPARRQTADSDISDPRRRLRPARLFAQSHGPFCWHACAGGTRSLRWRIVGSLCSIWRGFKRLPDLIKTIFTSAVRRQKSAATSRSSNETLEKFISRPTGLAKIRSEKILSRNKPPTLFTAGFSLAISHLPKPLLLDAAHIVEIGRASC